MSADESLVSVNIVRITFCSARLPVLTVIDKATSYERCVLRAGHDGNHQLQDGRRWENVRCISRCAVKDEIYSPVQCDLPAGHTAEHEAFRGDGIGASSHWAWDDSLSIPGWIPQAVAQPPKTRSFLSRVRDFFMRSSKA